MARRIDCMKKILALAGPQPRNIGRALEPGLGLAGSKGLSRARFLVKECAGAGFCWDGFVM
jgi:hypothetical protein